ncbi:putative bifunctional diguanylate cyclase/phosphodiesterase [Gorillibacterium sp. sgz5001074]|uniref:putative bifunctional diguanylate cyclase/phosphodiesterase n=1 Tax=Gorillibacterium sp. sgz5001074 TaxID=3446695 RepID=UPI003F67A002
MDSMITNIIFLFIPFVILIGFGIEIYVKNPSNPMNRDTMILMLSLSLFFLGGLGVYVLPFEYARPSALYVKYASVFFSMSIGLAFFSHVSRIRMNRALLRILRLLPMAGAAAIYLRMPGMTLLLENNGGWPVEQLDSRLWILLQLTAAYNFLLMFVFLLIGRKQKRSTKRRFKETQRLRIMLIGSVYTVAWALLTTAAGYAAEPYLNGPFHAALRSELPAYCILVWALTVRYAMVKYDFLAAAGRKFELLFRLSNQGIALVNAQGTAVESNAALHRILGLPNKDAADGIDLVPFLQTEEAQPVKQLFVEHFATLTPIQTELQITNLLRETLILQLDSDYIELDEEMLCYLVVRDITEKKHTENKLRKLAYQDSLTGLGNRAFFFESMPPLLDGAGSGGHLLALMMADLDQFKLINDTLGHSAGDQVLQHVARQIGRALPEQALVVRLGGDEFAVCIGLNEEAEAFQHAERVMDALQTPLELFGKIYTVSGSIGISFYPEDGSAPEELLRNADSAMYVAKQSGRSRYYRYTPSLKALAERHLSLFNGLGRALENEEFLLHYQPQIDIAARRIVGVEALIRWDSPELGRVSPDQFIPLAEETGAILGIGDWVLRQALGQARLWHAAGYTGLTVSVNLSANQLQNPHFAGRVAELIRDAGVPASMLCLEITESAAITNVDKSLSICRELTELGVSLAIDDFGIGYSSLSMMNRFPFRYIKIDRSLIQNIVADTRDADVALTIIELASRLKMIVIAEGVETPEQLSLLQDFGCQEAQGYLIGRPVEADQVTALLRQDTPTLPPAA